MPNGLSGWGHGKGHGGAILDTERLRRLLDKLVAISRPPVDVCLQAHPKPPRYKREPIRLVVETTSDEIVHIELRTPEAAVAACVENALWATRLPAQFDGNDRLEVSIPIAKTSARATR